MWLPASWLLDFSWREPAWIVQKLPWPCHKHEISVQNSKWLVVSLGQFSRVLWPLILLPLSLCTALQVPHVGADWSELLFFLSFHCSDEKSRLCRLPPLIAKLLPSMYLPFCMFCMCCTCTMYALVGGDYVIQPRWMG